ncbi:hypothetical protein [Methanocella conradii]|uniref:hypothetical protein n=1 Tax=Methanocella conradii TaxID=1175444 RepID=UPI00157C8A4D|nr:hypothetical protein [Methanocella conradii]
MSNNLLNVIKEVFSTYNYSVSASQQGFDLIAEKPGNRVGIKLVDDASADDLKTLLDGLKGNDIKVLFITMASFSDEVKKLCGQRDVLLWDRAELERQIGKAVLSGCDTAAPPKDLIRPSGDFSSLTGELYARSTPSPQKPMPDKVDAVEADEEPVKKKAKARPAPEPEGVAIPLHAIPIRIKASDAVKISGAIGRAEDVEVSLKFIPFWKYSYSLDVQSKYRDLTIPLSSKGSKIINAINKQISPAPAADPVESVELPDAPYNVEESVVTQEEANAMAIKNIIEENTKTVRFKGTQGEAAIVEHKKFQPRPQDIEMSMELLYIPFWAVRSHKGYMEINAYDGKPTKMPIDDGAEIL